MKSEEIASDLRQRIEAGRLPEGLRPSDALPAGSTMPTVDAIADAYGVHRNTGHQVHAQLKAAGLIHTRTGRSAIVADPSPLYVITTDAYDKAAHADGLTAWELQVTQIGDQPHTEHYQGRLTDGPNLGQDARGLSVADLLSAPEGEQFIHMAGDGWATPNGPTGEPDQRLKRVVQVYDAWYVADLLEQAPMLIEPRDGRWEGGAFGVIAEHAGTWPTPSRRIITERITTKAEEVRFRVPPMSLVSSEVEVSVDQLGEPLCVIHYRRLFGVAQWDLA